jgi:hypothetical protein
MLKMNEVIIICPMEKVYYRNSHSEKHFNTLKELLDSVFPTDIVVIAPYSNLEESQKCILQKKYEDVKNHNDGIKFWRFSFLCNWICRFFQQNVVLLGALPINGCKKCIRIVKIGYVYNTYKEHITEQDVDTYISKHPEIL